MNSLSAIKNKQTDLGEQSLAETAICTTPSCPRTFKKCSQIRACVWFNMQHKKKKKKVKSKTDNYNLISDGAGVRPDNIAVQHSAICLFWESRAKRRSQEQTCEKIINTTIFISVGPSILIRQIRSTIGEFKLGRMGKILHNCCLCN